jgi:hypothetical protein
MIIGAQFRETSPNSSIRARLLDASKGQIPRASLDAYSLYCTPRPLLPDFDSGHVVEVREAPEAAASPSTEVGEEIDAYQHKHSP